MSSRIYITTPIYYVNAPPHLGHSYTTILCDILNRLHRLIGAETWFQTGVDEHGDKIARAAGKSGQTPQEYADRISAQFERLWPELHIEHSNFIRTTEARHKQVVRRVLQQLYDKGEIYSATYGGFYCTGCERYYTEKELVDGKCPDHEAPLEWIEESNYFFRMGKYQDWLIKHVEGHPEFIRPEKFRNKILSFLKDPKEPLKDLSISRPRARVPWGIPLPFDEAHVTYVWFDALLNYCSALDWPDGELFKKFWPAAQHVIAKDILIPHAVYWPTMLKAAGIPLYQHLNVHGYWNIDQRKMSKERGNVVPPLALAQKYGVDAFRYYLAREMKFGNDADFSEVVFVERINSELANRLGNLVKRLTGMIAKYCAGGIPALSEPPLPEHNGDTAEFFDDLERLLLEPLETRIRALDVHGILDAVHQAIQRLDKAVTDLQPWALHKAGKLDALHFVLNRSARLLGIIGQILTPVMPVKGPELLSVLGCASVPRTLDPELARAGLRVDSERVLFPKFEPLILEGEPAMTEHGREKTANSPAVAFGAAEGAIKVALAAPLKPEIEFADFEKLDLRVATVLNAEAVPETEKLLRLELNDGSGKIRRIVAGIAQHYSAAQLIGRQIVIVANLKPRKLKGIESQGMLLAAHGGAALKLIAPEQAVSPGGIVS